MVIQPLWEEFGYPKLRRMPVRGGWIVESWTETTSSIVFVPDFNHEWEVREKAL